MSETFGQYIRLLREEKGLTQRVLSQAVGFRSLAHLSDIESGKRNPAKGVLPKLAKALGVSAADLESRDAREPIEAAKVLFARKPEMVGAFLKVIEAAKKMDADELVERVTAKKSPPPEPLLATVPVPQPSPVSAKEPAEKKATDQPTLF